MNYLVQLERPGVPNSYIKVAEDGGFTLQFGKDDAHEFSKKKATEMVNLLESMCAEGVTISIIKA